MALLNWMAWGKQRLFCLATCQVIFTFGVGPSIITGWATMSSLADATAIVKVVLFCGIDAPCTVMDWPITRFVPMPGAASAHRPIILFVNVTVPVNCLVSTCPPLVSM